MDGKRQRVVTITHWVLIDGDEIDADFYEAESQFMAGLCRQFRYPLIGGETFVQSLDDWTRRRDAEAGA